MNPRRSIRVLLVIVALVLATLACSMQKSEAPAEVPQEATVPNQPPEAAFTPTTGPSQPQETAPTLPPTITPAPIVTPVPAALPLELIDFGFGQSEDYMGFGFLVKNPNTDFTITDSEYTLLAYDANNVVVDSYPGWIDYLGPGQTLGIGNDYYIEGGIIIDHIEVKLEDGTPEKADSLPQCEIRGTYYTHGEYLSRVLGEAFNPTMEIFDPQTIYALLYDDAGKIVGGGYTYLDFVPAMESTGFYVLVHGSSTATRAEVYPAIYSLSGWGDKENMPQDAKGLEMVKLGSASDEYATSYAFTVNNPNAAYDLKSSRFIVTAYGADGLVVDVTSGYLDYVLAGQKTGIAGSFYTYDSPAIDTVKVQIANGDYEQAANPPWFTTSGIEYKETSYSSEVDAVVTNHFAKDAENLTVYAVLYNANGDIIGGGYNTLTLVPANGDAMIDIPVTASEYPTSAEVFASIWDFSDLQ